MFRNWGFLLTEMWGLLALAGLLGLFAGWLIWARRTAAIDTSSHDAAIADRDRQIAALKGNVGDRDTRIAELEAGTGNGTGVAAAAGLAAVGGLAVSGSDQSDYEAQISGLRGEVQARDARITTLEADLSRAGGDSAKLAERDSRIAQLESDLAACRASQSNVAATATPAAVMSTPEAPVEGTRPTTLTAPRDGGADDLKRIKGVGPQMEKLCNELGFYHFDQIASWTPSEVAWVDQNLKGFTGRVTRDNWIEQAQLLAEGGETSFSKKVDKGDVYKN